MRSASSASVTRRIGGLRALLVDVPALEMLERRGVHGDQRRMDDRPGIHQRAGERVAAVLDHAGKRAADHVERMVLQPQRKHAGRQPLGADRDRHLERPVLARQPGQGAGLGEGRVGAVAGVVRRLSRKHTSRTCRAAGTRPVRPCRCGASARAMSGCAVAGAGQRISSASRTASRDVVRHQRQLRLVPAAKILHQDRAAGRACAATAARSRRHSRTS